MRRQIVSILILALLLLAVVGPPSAGQQPAFPLDNCKRGCFSTEEDFVTQGPEPYDGNPIISDGDLLSFSGQVCARNADLLSRFYPDGRVPADLGLDAVDVLDIETRLVAFSTELDDPRGVFTAGDLLFTNGGIIPNRALVDAFGISYDIGLDGVHFVGTKANILAFAALIPQIEPEGWLQGRLKQELDRYQIDLWFSIEGTFQPVGAAMILDGDLLSATGNIVATQASLLPPNVPAGLPQRGVDFGLDAVTAATAVSRVPPIYFSTEILYRGERTPFTDGDVLLRGNGVVAYNEDLIRPFEPKVDFLGLDALDIVLEAPEEPEPRITHIGQVAVTDIDGGNVPVGGTGTGLATTFGYERPYGAWVPIYGDIPSGIDEYRVVYRKAGDPRPSDPATANGIPVVPGVGWRASDYNAIYNDCSGWTPYFSDANGWFDAVEFRRLEQGEGMPFDCNAQLALTVWDSTSAPDPNGHYVVWLQWRIGAGPIHEEPFDHHVQFDNKAPENLDMAIPGGACTEYGPTDMPIMIQAHFDDPHFWRYRLRIFGGDPPVGHWYSVVNYDDATPAAANVGPTGTGVGLVDLHEVDVNDLPAGSVVDCCYGVRLWVEDRTIIGSFSPPFNLLPWGFGHEDDMEITFAYSPGP
ncbi:MAG: hypothetical protein H5T69_09385 [Chloroflexi bacterium]|nr:hypothetical protein [Chloroflexota bacterium]